MTTCPFVTAVPTGAFTERTLPGIGAVIFTPPCAPAAAFGAAAGAAFGAAFGAAAGATGAVPAPVSSTWER